MSNRWRRRPQLEPLESLTLTSSVSATFPHAGQGGVASLIAHRPKVPTSRSTLLEGTLHGTFFAHKGNTSTGTVYSLFASGKIAPLGPTLLVGGFETSGFTAGGAGGGNLIFTTESPPGNLYLRLKELSSPASGQYQFAYEITNASGAVRDVLGSGTVAITLQPIKTNIHGQPVSNPGFFGNSTLTFRSGAVPLA